MNKDTKKARYFIRAYKHSERRCLSDCYKSYSFYKCRAFDECTKHCKLDNGINLKIISANAFHFSVGYLVKQTDKNKVTLHIITASNDYLIKDIDINEIL